MSETNSTNDSGTNSSNDSEDELTTKEYSVEEVLGLIGVIVHLKRVSEGMTMDQV